MATQVDIANHLFLSEKWVRELLKKGVLPSSSGRGGYDTDKCREAYIVYLRGLNSGQVSQTSESEPGDVRDEKGTVQHPKRLEGNSKLDVRVVRELQMTMTTTTSKKQLTCSKRSIYKGLVLNFC